MTVELDSDKGPQVPSHLLVPNETRTGNQNGQSKRRKLPRVNQKSKYEHVGKPQARENADERVAIGFNFAFTWLRRWHWICSPTWSASPFKNVRKGKRANLKNDCLPGFGRARKGTSLFHEIVRRKDGCSLRKVSLSKTSLTNILPFGFPEISTNRVRSILEIWRNFLFVLLYRKDSLEETGMSLHR